jgi:hypothetical protein
LKIAHVVLPVLGVMSLAAPAGAATLYASSAAGGPGELYILNPANGAVLQDVGPLNDAAAVNYGITGLAVSPTTGILYGSTANNVPATAARLVSINPASGRVTVIGAFNVPSAGTPPTMGDLAFDAAGNLYGVGTTGGPQLYTINLATGQATVVGSTGLTSTEGGSLAVSPSGVFYGGPTSSRFGTYNPVTGAYTNITNPVEPVGGAFAAFDFDPAGVLYGLDLGPDTAGKPTHLATINPSNGAVTDLGASVAQLDAIAFAVPEPGTAGLLVAVALGLQAPRRRRRRRAQPR